MMASDTPDLPKFDSSRMILLNDPAHGGQGGGPREPPFIVLASAQILKERPDLQDFMVDRQEPWSIWAGNDPEPLYFSFPDLLTLTTNAGDPFPHDVDGSDLHVASPQPGRPSLKSFDDSGRPDFEAGSTLKINDAALPSTASEPAISVSALSASGVSVFYTEVNAAEVAYEIQAKLRSASWTGIEARIEAFPGAKDDVYRRIVALDRALEKCGLTNIEAQKSKALTSALIKLVASPEPAWDAILGILTSRGMTAILNVTQVATIFAALGKALLG